MNKPILDVVLLLLVVVVFGLHQRRRPHLYFRFWVAGWICVFLSYAIWEFPVSDYRLGLVEDCLRYDISLASGLLFALSFLVTRKTMKMTMLALAVIVVGASAEVDIQTLQVQAFSPPVLRLLLMALVVVAHAAAIVKTQLDKLKQTAWQRASLSTAITLFGLVMLVMLCRNPRAELADISLCEVFVCAAWMHARSYRGFTLVGVLGTVGLASWGLFYLAGKMLLDLGHITELRLLWSFWNVPKYLLGLYMILKIVEEERDENNALAQQYSKLYEDFRNIYESHPYPMWIYDSQTKLFLSANSAATEIYGFSVEEFARMQHTDLEPTVDEELDEVDQIVPAPVGGRRGRHVRKDGSVMWVNLYEHEFLFQGRPAVNLMARDVTQQLQFSKEMAHRAQHDELTGLPERTMLYERLEQGLVLGQQQSKRMALLALDVDHFKLINDTYGHMAGDECLKTVADRLRRRIRHADMVARTGGEEFMAIVSGLTSESDASRVAQQLLDAFKEPVRLPDCDLAVTVSIGIAVYPDHGEDSETLRRLADDALYQAKRDGRNCARMAQLN